MCVCVEGGGVATKVYRAPSGGKRGRIGDQKIVFVTCSLEGQCGGGCVGGMGGMQPKNWKGEGLTKNTIKYKVGRVPLHSPSPPHNVSVLQDDII